MERPRVVRIAYALCWLSMVVSIPSIVDALVTVKQFGYKLVDPPANPAG